MNEGVCLDGANGHHSEPNPSQVEKNAGVEDTHHDEAEGRKVAASQVAGSLDKRIQDTLNTIPPLQQQVIDLTEKLTRMEDTFRRVSRGMESFIEKLKDQSSSNEKHTSQNGDGNPIETDGNGGRPEGDDTEATKYEDKEDKASEKEEEVEAGSLAEYKIMHVSPKTVWPMQITKCRTADFRRFAVFVYFETDDDEINLSDAHQGEPSDGTLPIRIIINSKRLDTLLEEISGINLPALPYTIIKIRPFQGDMKLTYLEYVPKQFLKTDCPALNALAVRGEKFLKSRRAKLFTEEEDYTLEIANDHDFGNLTPEHMVLLPRDLLGYGLKSKKWFRLDVEKFDPNPADDNTRQRAFNNLVLPQRVKDLLQAMVRNHANALKDIQYSDSEETDGPLGEVDLVQGKAKGLIIFLYGPPGVGKVNLLLSMEHPFEATLSH
ncbi:hypothetical protein K4K54_006905, partial [Colletotrichum sp. SAR 10_86]